MLLFGFVEEIQSIPIPPNAKHNILQIQTGLYHNIANSFISFQANPLRLSRCHLLNSIYFYPECRLHIIVWSKHMGSLDNITFIFPNGKIVLIYVTKQMLTES